MNRPHLLLLVLVSALQGAACVVNSHDEASCDPNPCTQPNRGTCVDEAGEARCLCDAGFIARPNGTCEPVGPSNCAQHSGDAAEPDDCQALAHPLAGDGTALQQSIDPIGDYDFFQFSGLADNLYSLTAKGEGTLMPRVDVFDQGGVWLTAAEAPGRVTLFFKAHVTSPYFARLSHSPLDPSVATGGYSLSLTHLGEEDHGDFADAATSVSPDPIGSNNPSIFFGRFEYPSDQDWFRFSGSGGRSYRLSFDPDLNKVRPAVAIFAGSNLRQPLLTAQTSEVSFTLPVSDAVFIVMDPPQRSEGSYAFKLFVN